MEVTIINNTKYVKHIGEVSLNIGANVIEEEKYNAVKEHPIVKRLIEDGDIEVQEGNLDDITKVTPGSKAIKVVETTFSKETLQKWLDTETRKSVVEAINKQLEYLKKEKKDE